MRKLTITAIVSAALGCAVGYALAPGGETGTNASFAADRAPVPGQLEAEQGHGRGGGMGGGGRPGPGSGVAGGRGHGGRPGIGGGGQRGPGAAEGPGRPRRPATGFDPSDLERSLAYMSVALTLEDAQQRVIRDAMQAQAKRMEELREAISAALTPEQRAKLRVIEAVGSPG